ncbi:epimerase [Azorhizobium oxalatiphilum]|uniref:Epimerase n=1 Tax=Azorhizobium oxalatiphilum TaxID=980631 RepID=A0A917C697_9HYPH|nr:NAD(P)H-binding protein [Azorhizobium oxalatiphilum]GGF72617.1 epimerase [Azorhizobium oxalatiphilum]
MKVIIFGATGMVGQSVVRECLLDPHVVQILAIGRSPSNILHSKVSDLVPADMFCPDAVSNQISGYDVCMFCLGTSSLGKDEPDYSRITHDLTVAWGQALARGNPEMRFLYISARGAGLGKSMWARVKARTETALLALFPNAVMFRLGILRPLHRERSRSRGGDLFLALMSPFWPLVTALAPHLIITSEELGRAMVAAAKGLAPKPILENEDMIALGRAEPARRTL